MSGALNRVVAVGPASAQRTDGGLFTPSRRREVMTEFDLDLGAIEQDMDEGREREVILGLLDGTTPGEDWVDAVAAGNVLVLAVDGLLTDLAADFAPQIREGGGSVVHFRDFLVVAPPDVDVDTSRL